MLWLALVLAHPKCTGCGIQCIASLVSGVGARWLVVLAGFPVSKRGMSTNNIEQLV